MEGLMKFIDKFEKLDLPIHGVRLPEMEIDDTMRVLAGASKDCTNFDFLRKLALNTFNADEYEKLSNRQEYIDRAKHELAIIEELGFTDYFLISFSFDFYPPDSFSVFRKIVEKHVAEQNKQGQ